MPGGLTQLVYISPGNPTAYLPPAQHATAFPATMKSLFSNNAQVYYKPGTLSTGSTGTVVNAGRKAKRT